MNSKGLGACYRFVARYDLALWRVRTMSVAPSELEVVIPQAAPEKQDVDKASNMYANAETWNPFKGCRFDCVYCRPSFQKQAKRQKKRCQDCYQYAPHCHEDRLTTSTVPATGIVFVAGDADICFCPPEFTRRIIERIKTHLLWVKRRKAWAKRKKTFYFQSKKPSYLRQFPKEFPPEVILATTLETNRNEGYRQISRAPVPSVRYRQFKSLDYPRKVVTIEPVMDFDLNPFVEWIVDLRPEYVWLGFNSRPESVTLPEPSLDKVRKFMQRLAAAGISVRGKTLRGLQVPKARAERSR